MSKTWNYQTAGTVDITTTGNIDDLDFSGCSIIRMNNASLATIRGLKAGYPGQEVNIVSVGAGQVDFAHQNAGSVAANRLVNYATVGTTPLAAGIGTCTYKYDETTARWRLFNHNQGVPIAVTYSATDFTADVGTWTVSSVDATTFTYLLIGRMLFIELFLETTSVSATPQFLQVLIPNSFIAAKSKRQIISTIDNTAPLTGFNLVIAASNLIRSVRDTAGNLWAISVNNTYVLGGIYFEVQ